MQVQDRSCARYDVGLTPAGGHLNPVSSVIVTTSDTMCEQIAWVIVMRSGDEVLRTDDKQSRLQVFGAESGR